MANDRLIIPVNIGPDTYLNIPIVWEQSKQKVTLIADYDFPCDQNPSTADVLVIQSAFRTTFTELPFLTSIVLPDDIIQRASNDFRTNPNLFPGTTQRIGISIDTSKTPVEINFIRDLR